MQTRFMSGTAAELHALAMPTSGDEAELWVMQPTATALVMGSSQKPEGFDLPGLEADRVQLATRRSGGGAVFIDPATTVWIDVVAPRTSEWWSSELAENFLIVGRAWQAALRSLGVNSDLCVDAPVRTDASSMACWAGVGWGELTVNVAAGTAKVVGLSQRRTRWGSRVQAMAVLDGASARVSDYLLAENRPTIVQADTAVSVDELTTAVLANF